MRIYFFLICILYACGMLYGQVPVQVTKEAALYNVVKSHIQYLEDKNSSFSINEVAQVPFLNTSSDVPGFFISSSSFWVKFIIQNETEDPHLIINLEHATIDRAVLYYKVGASGEFDSTVLTEAQPFRNRKYNYQTYMFDAEINKGEQKTFFLK
ncbi:7TMR-DISMED2 domain-containing protein [Niabella ginsengisoli]|uniref:7TM-DISM receptor extracellular domain-containing protein n=1 Tax=Niabella ginsengisoli TaxID=522298 RepID=A0ABS9SP76_9BACT|nr:7TM-DISM domain-containing protein [Niabella ginsengisoli]MCH5600160.1 hypothetical protein [Niabella ginsengisoli]